MLWRKTNNCLRKFSELLIGLIIGLVVISILVLFLHPSVNPDKATLSVVSIEADYKESNQITDFFIFSNSFEKKMKNSKETRLPRPPKSTFTVSQRFGTGFVINGKIITCYHVVQDAFRIVITTNDNKTQGGKIERVDKESDLAEISVARYPGSLTLSKILPLRQEKVWQIGNPYELKNILTAGIFLCFNFSDKQNVALLDTYSGNSGSPILNHRGEVVGMTHTIIPGTRFTGIGTLQDLRNFLKPNEPR